MSSMTRMLDILDIIFYDNRVISAVIIIILVRVTYRSPKASFKSIS